MPLAVYVLGVAIFAQGTSELMLAGLVPQLATDLGVSIPDAGLLISAFALGMLVGAPVLAVVTLRWSRRAALLAFLAVFALAHVGGALAPGYGALLAARVVAAFVYAGFWAAAAATAAGLVPQEVRGRAMGVLVSGITVATVVGLPAGTALGQHLGWRAVFWAIVALSVAAMAAVAAVIPGGRPDSTGSTPDLRRELRAMAEPRLWLSYGTTALMIGGLLATFGYLAPLLTDTTGLPEGWVPTVLATYGVGTLIGTAVGGRTADAHPYGSLYAGIGGLAATSVLLALSAGVAALTVPLVFVLGLVGFLANPAVSSRVFTLAEGAPTLAAAGNISAFNLGIVAGPWLGGLAISAGAGYPSVAWVGAALATGSLVTVAAAHRWGEAGAVGQGRVREPAGRSGSAVGTGG